MTSTEAFYAGSAVKVYQEDRLMGSQVPYTCNSNSAKSFKVRLFYCNSRVDLKPEDASGEARRGSRHLRSDLLLWCGLWFQSHWRVYS